MFVEVYKLNYILYLSQYTQFIGRFLVNSLKINAKIPLKNNN